MMTTPPNREGLVEVLYTVGVTGTTPQFSLRRTGATRRGLYKGYDRQPQ
jgi:hypothetical protein